MSCWVDEHIKKCQENFRKDTDRFFEATHYEWMYRLTRDEKYLKKIDKLFKKKT